MKTKASDPSNTHDLDSSITADFACFIAEAIPISTRSSFTEKEWRRLEYCSRKLYLAVKAVENKRLKWAAQAIRPLRRHFDSLPESLKNAHTYVSAVIWEPERYPAEFEQEALST